MRVDSPQTLAGALSLLNKKTREQQKIPNLIHVGDWTLTEDEDGNLVAVDANGSTTTIARAT